MNHVKKSLPPLFFSIILASSLVLSIFSMIPSVDAIVPYGVTEGEIFAEMTRPSDMATFDDCLAATTTGFRTASEDSMLIWINCQLAGNVGATWFVYDGNYTLQATCAVGADHGGGNFCPDEALGGIYPMNDFTMLSTTIGGEIQTTRFNGTHINVISEFATGCTATALTHINPDQSGFWWFACGDSTDKVYMWNAFANAVRMESPDLSDGGANDCVEPVGVSVDYDAFKGYIFCDNGANNVLVSFDIDYASGVFSWGGKIESEVVNTLAGCVAGEVSIQEVAFRNAVVVYGCNSLGGIATVDHANDGTGLVLGTALTTPAENLHGRCSPYSSNFIICGSASENSFQFEAFNQTEPFKSVVNVNCASCSVEQYADWIGFNFGSTWVMPSSDGANGAGFLIVQGVQENFPYTPLAPEDFDETCVVELDEDCDSIADIADSDCDGDGITNATDDDDNEDCLGDDVFPPTAPSVGGEDYEVGTIPEALLNALTANGGFSREAAGLLWTLIIHGAIFAGMMMIQIKLAPGSGVNASVVFIMFILAGGLSLAMGFMPLVFWLGEMAVLGIGLALTTGKLIGVGGG